MVTRRLGIIVLLFCFYLNLMLCPVQAASTEAAVELIDVNQRCTLTITYSGNGEAFPRCLWRCIILRMYLRIFSIR